STVTCSPFPIHTTMVWDSSPVGDLTGSTHRGSGVVDGQGVVVGEDVTVSVAVGGFEPFLLRVRVGSTAGRATNEGVTYDPADSVLVGDVGSVNVWVGVCVVAGVSEAAVVEAVCKGKPGVPVVSAGIHLPRNSTMPSSDATIPYCLAVSVICPS